MTSEYDNSVVNEISAIISIRSDSLDPSVVTKALGHKPEVFGRKGELHTLPSGKKHARTHGRWDISSWSLIETEDRWISDHLPLVIKFLSDHSRDLKRLRLQYDDMTIYCDISFAIDYPVCEFSLRQYELVVLSQLVDWIDFNIRTSNEWKN